MTRFRPSLSQYRILEAICRVRWNLEQDALITVEKSGKFVLITGIRSQYKTTAIYGLVLSIVVIACSAYQLAQWL